MFRSGGKWETVEIPVARKKLLRPLLPRQPCSPQPLRPRPLLLRTGRNRRSNSSGFVKRHLRVPFFNLTSPACALRRAGLGGDSHNLRFYAESPFKMGSARK